MGIILSNRYRQDANNSVMTILDGDYSIQPEDVNAAAGKLEED